MNRILAYKTDQIEKIGLSRSDSILIIPADNIGAQNESLFLSALVESIHSRGLKASILTPSRDSSGRKSLLAKFRQVLRMIPHYRVIHIIAADTKSFWSEVIPLVLVARFFSKKILLTFETALPEDFFARYARLAIPILRLADSLHVQTAWSGGQFLKHNFDVTVLSFPVDIISAKYAPAKRLQPRIICDRPMNEGSNIMCLLKAFVFVKQKYPRTEIVLSGNGPGVASLKKYVADERIHGVEFQNGKIQDSESSLWDEADLYVNSSTVDTFPASITRAFALGLPVITTDAGAITEVVRDRVNGLVVAVNDHVGMAERIIELIENDKLVADLSAHARRDAETQSIETLARSWDDFYRRHL